LSTSPATCVAAALRNGALLGLVPDDTWPESSGFGSEPARARAVDRTALATLRSFTDNQIECRLAVDRQPREP
jgi:hypothetical protein